MVCHLTMVHHIRPPLQAAIQAPKLLIAPPKLLKAPQFMTTVLFISLLVDDLVVAFFSLRKPSIHFSSF